jgi:CelD/BcsL family acetyltransferase involved in cellulose biosynthesis
MTALTASIATTADELCGVREEWDDLALQRERPFSAPAWPLAWWDSLRPSGAEMRVVLVHDGDELVGVLPLFCTGGHYAPLGGGTAPVEPLAAPRREREVAEAAAGALERAQPRPTMLEVEAHGSSPGWAVLLGEAWGDGRGAWRWQQSNAPVPCVDLGQGLDRWMAEKSSSFRREAKRKRRRLEEVDASFRFASKESLERDVSAFMRLHRDRLAGQGGSSLQDEGVERMLVAVGRELLPLGRFRLLCIDLDGEPIAAQMLLSAGQELSAWNSGFDEAHAKLSPSMQCILEALRDGSERGERTMSLGPGGQDYKYRLADSEDSLDRHVLIPHGSSYPLARVRLMPRQVRDALGRRLSPEAKRRIRGLVRR